MRIGLNLFLSKLLVMGQMEIEKIGFDVLENSLVMLGNKKGPMTFGDSKRFVYMQVDFGIGLQYIQLLYEPEISAAGNVYPLTLRTVSPKLVDELDLELHEKSERGNLADGKISFCDKTSYHVKPQFGILYSMLLGGNIVADDRLIVKSKDDFLDRIAVLSKDDIKKRSVPAQLISKPDGSYEELKLYDFVGMRVVTPYGESREISAVFTNGDDKYAFVLPSHSRCFELDLRMKKKCMENMPAEVARQVEYDVKNMEKEGKNRIFDSTSLLKKLLDVGKVQTKTFLDAAIAETSEKLKICHANKAIVEMTSESGKASVIMNPDMALHMCAMRESSVYMQRHPAD
jgi:hypothetical protein